MRKTEKNYANLTALEVAQKKVENLKKVYISLFIYSIGLTIFLLKEYGNIAFNFFPIRYINWFVMSIWTFAVVVKCIKFYIDQTIFGTDWENRKIQQFMKSENQKTQSWE